MYQVFISYQRTDSSFAREIQTRLEANGLTAWLDKGELLPGDEWCEGIDQGIKASSALIVVISPEAKASEYVTYEWSFAWGAGVPVIPLLLRPVAPLHPRLEALQYVSFIKEPYPWDVLFKTLDLVVHERGIRSVPIPRDAPAHVKRAVSSLDGATVEERYGAVETLGQSGHKTGIEAVRHALRHPMKDVRLRSAAALAKAKILDETVVSGLMEPWWNNSEEYEQEYRDVSIKAFELAGAAAIPTLLNIYVSDLPGHDNATMWIGRHDSSSALVKVALDKESPKKVRLAAMRLVAEIRYTLAYMYLKPLLSESDEEIREEARCAIKRIEFLETDPRNQR